MSAEIALLQLNITNAELALNKERNLRKTQDEEIKRINCTLEIHRKRLIILYEHISRQKSSKIISITDYAKILEQIQKEITGKIEANERKNIVQKVSNANTQRTKEIETVIESYRTELAKFDNDVIPFRKP